MNHRNKTDGEESITTPPLSPSNGSVPRISSKELFVNCDQIRIDHEGQEYQLRITRQGKLILTK